MTKTGTWMPVLVVSVGVALSAASARAQEGMPDMKAMMKKMEAACKAGKEHAQLAKAAGKWDITVKIWGMGPAAPPMVSKGTAEIESIHDGKFIKETLKYDMVMPDADGNMGTKTVTGFSIMGYNNFRKLYETVYFDNISTSFIQMSGTSPPGSNKVFLYGLMDEPMLDMVGRTIKAVATAVSDDKHLFELYDLAAGENYKVIEIEYVRKK